MSLYPSKPGIDVRLEQSRTGSSATSFPRSTRVLRKKDLAKKIGCSESTVDNRVNPLSPWHDATFPKSIELGAGGTRRLAKGWIEYTVDEWLESRKEAAYRH
jgi:prophage regulatory protein